MHEKNRRMSVNSLLFIPWTFLLCIGIRNVARKSRDEITVFENHPKCPIKTDLSGNTV